jgi:1-deoxy-D-xylulose-5-phosphate reductoisomerase
VVFSVDIMVKKKIAILGSTGSIGVNVLNVIEKYSERFEVIGLVAGKNISLLSNQIEKFSPVVVSVKEKEDSIQLKQRWKDIKILYGEEGIIHVATFPEVDMVVSAIVGISGLKPIIEAVKCGKDIALANKEALVASGQLLMDMVAQYNVQILPVDSEHSALFQCLMNRNKLEIKQLILTASGGPFRDREDLEDITPEEALKHPTWCMGKKISVDSATLMNKGLEVIEAQYLFKISADNIQVIIHPQSIIHSLVEFIDGTMIAQLSLPDMRAAIAYALTYPERLEGVINRLELAKIKNLSFEIPNIKKFPCLQYAYNAAQIGGTMPAVINAANEAAVNQFLNKKIGFTDIPKIIEKLMNIHQVIDKPSLDDIFEVDRWAKEIVYNITK